MKANCNENIKKKKKKKHLSLVSTLLITKKKKAVKPIGKAWGRGESTFIQKKLMAFIPLKQ